jgi:iterative type I PKS product template protein
MLQVPPDRFDYTTHCDATGKSINTSHTPYGCWIENPGFFDPRFFNMSPREAYQTDPMQRMAITTAYEALEMSGYVPNRTRSTKLDRIGSFYGQTSDDWREINAAQEVDTYYITGGVRAFGPGRINYHFGFSGPSFSIDTACSSSMAALQLACTSLWAKDCDTAIVGGLSCMTNSDIFSGLSRGQFLSKKGPCATFDNDADGYCRADGCGTVILKRIEDAIADKDNILALILGTATNHSADAVSITHPHGGTQEILYRNILDMAGVDPLDVDYVEMHGTGTQAGDGTEMKSVTNVFAPADRKRSAQQSLYLGSVKANVGHGEAASGVTALIKVLMMLQKSTIPPHIGIKKTINKTFPKDLAERNVHIAYHSTPLIGKPGQPRRVFVNNFSAAGGNSGLLLEDGPAQVRGAIDGRSTHVISITAKSKSAMIKNTERLIEYIEQHPNASLGDISYTTTARRIQHNWRIAVTGFELNQVKGLLKAKLTEAVTPIPSVPPNVAFAFTGQGSHYAALGKELLENSSLFRESILEFNNLALIHGLPSFMPLIDGSVVDISSLSPVVVQLGLLCFEMAMALLWSSWGITPSVVLGHSLGEYAALNIAGVLSASDAIYLVGSRAQILLDKCTVGTHAMLAVQGSVASVQEALSERAADLNVACINGARETVLSGETADMESVASDLTAAGFKCTPLKVPFAFHSAQVDPILDDFEKLASSVTFNAPRIPIISTLLGRQLEAHEAINPEYLRRHAREPVNFLGGLTSAQAAGLLDEKTIFLEVGPHPVCLGMVKATAGNGTVAVPSLRRIESAYKTISNSISVLHIAGLTIDWNEYHRDFLDAVQILHLPTYAFDEKNYWLQYTGDWCLTKNRGSAGSAKLLEDVKPRLSTTTVHRIVEESFSGDKAMVLIESDLARPDLAAAVGGHLVNGAKLCPSSIYADQAITICEYAYKTLRPDSENIGANVSQMEVVKPLIGRSDGSSQILRITAQLDLSRMRADLVYSSGTDKTRIDHATCVVHFGDRSSWLAEWQRTAYLIQSRIDWLKDAEKVGKASKIGRGLAYKLFTALVDYDPKYRGMTEVILASENMEATSQVNFQTKPEDGNFVCSPYWIDSVAHISGFIVNGTDAFDSRNQVFVSHGWESMRVAEPFSQEKTYRSYVRMQPAGGKMVAGDVYVFDGDRVVAVVGGLKFQCIPRTLLNTFLPPTGSAVIAPAARPATTVKKATTVVQPTKTAKISQVTERNLKHINKKLSSVCSQALDILAKEIGVGLDELVDNIAFADLGVDSLMSLTVSGRMREELDIAIESSLFIDCPTIGEFKLALGKYERRDSATSDQSETSESDALTDQSTPDLDDTSPLSTPPSGEEPDIDHKEDSLLDTIRGTIAEEVGVEPSEIDGADNLASLGIDSLMSLTILGNLREKTGMDFPADLFIICATLKEIKKTLNIGPPVVKIDRIPPAAPPVPAPVVTVQQTQATIAPPVSSTKPVRKAKSVLLQGRVKTATRHLWMVPDGSGSATSYTDIPELASDLAVWGLNSPFMKTPEEYDCGVYGIATYFIDEIKRRQPVGPYMLSGWSAGGVIAFEILNQLVQAGNEVSHLIIIDAPCPLIIEPLPSSLHRWFGSIGLLGDGDLNKLPPWLLPHFAASVTALSGYTATEIPADKAPMTTAIWCEDGVCKYETDPRPDPYPYGHAQFLLENRSDFGPNLWDTYLPLEKMRFRQMSGNHFTMMGGELV